MTDNMSLLTLSNYCVMMLKDVQTDKQMIPNAVGNDRTVPRPQQMTKTAVKQLQLMKMRSCNRVVPGRH